MPHLFETLNLPINPLTLLDITERSICPVCNTRQYWYCPICGIPTSLPPMNIPALPIPVKTLFYPGESLKKSSAQLINVLKPANFSLETIDFDAEPPEGAVLLFPSDDAQTVDEVDFSKVNVAYVLDCTWRQSTKCLSSNFLKNVKKVKIQGHKTEFWRPHGRGEDSGCLSTCECIYWLVQEIALKTGSSDNYDGLMTLFVAQSCLVRKNMYISGRSVVALGRKAEKKYGDWLDLQKLLNEKYSKNDEK